MSERRVEVRRNPNGSVDEVLLYDGDECLFHLEQMDFGRWWFGLYPRPDVDASFDLYINRRTIHVIER